MERRGVTGQTRAPAPMGSGEGSESRLGPLSELLKLGDAPSVTGLSDGLQAAYVFASDVWKDAALAAVYELAAAGRDFSIDDVRHLGVQEPDKPQRWGSLLAVAKNDGLIERVGLQEHRTPKGDGNLVRLWRGTASAASKAA